MNEGKGPLDAEFMKPNRRVSAPWLTNKGLLLTSSGAWLVYFVSMLLALFDLPVPERVINLFGMAGMISLVVLLLLNGTFIGSRQFRLLYGALGFYVLGALFKILHWEYANMWLTFGLALPPLLYLSFAIRKPKFTLVDVMKIIWVAAYFSVAIFGGVLHYPLSMAVFLGLDVWLLTIGGIFVFQMRRQGVLFNR